jgi:hypothetical protein
MLPYLIVKVGQRVSSAGIGRKGDTGSLSDSNAARRAVDEIAKLEPGRTASHPTQ